MPLSFFSDSVLFFPRVDAEFPRRDAFKALERPGERPLAAVSHAHGYLAEPDLHYNRKPTVCKDDDVAGSVSDIGFTNRYSPSGQLNVSVSINA